MAGTTYILTQSDIDSLKRVIRKVDGIRGPGVTNTPDALFINSPTGNQSKGKRFGEGIWLKIVGETLISGQNNKWRYSFVQQRLVKDNEWEDSPDGLSSTAHGLYAFNSVEANNSASGVQGNGVNVTTLPAGYTLQPIQGNPVVWARAETDCDGGAQFYFELPNAIDGVCE